MTRGGGSRVEQPSSSTDLAQLWTTIVEGTAPAQRVWLATSKPVMHAENTFVIAVPNEFTMNQYVSKLRTWVEDTLTGHLGRPTRLVVTIDPKLDTGASAAPAQVEEGTLDGTHTESRPTERTSERTSEPAAERIAEAPTPTAPGPPSGPPSDL